MKPKIEQWMRAAIKETTSLTSCLERDIVIIAEHYANAKTQREIELEEALTKALDLLEVEIDTVRSFTHSVQSIRAVIAEENNHQPHRRYRRCDADSSPGRISEKRNCS